MDADLDPEIDLAGTLPTTNGDDPNNPEQSTRDINMEINNTDDEIPESREPTRKDISLRDFLGKMDEYAPIVRFPPSSAPPSPFSARFLFPSPHKFNHQAGKASN